MRTLSIAAVVGGVLASAAASAANYDLFIGGASAQSAFFNADFRTTVCGANPVTTYTITGASVSNEAWRCTAGVTTVTGILVGDVVTVHYNSELGTISGVSPLFYNNAIAARLFVNPDSADCAGTVCTVTSYSNQTETFTSANGTALLPMNSFPGRVAGAFTQFDIGVLDVEIKHWGLPSNWTDASFNTAMGTIPSVAGLVALPGATPMNGQVFSVIVNNAGPAAALGNLSYRSLSSIMAGKYDVWGDVPEVGGANVTPIKLCRREFGSGTQTSASMYFTGLECGTSSQSFASILSPGSLTSVVENASTGAVRTCVQGDVGAIGVTSLSTNTNWTTLNIDGVQANAHNAAAGFYDFAFETVVYNRATTSGASSPVQNLATSLINNAKRSDRLTSQVETTAVLGANGQWTVPSSRRVAYALPIGGTGNTPPTVAKVKGDISPVDGTIDRASIALTYNSGDNCKRSFNSNAN
jgi:hypothetical protein